MVEPTLQLVSRQEGGTAENSYAEIKTRNIISDHHFPEVPKGPGEKFHVSGDYAVGIDMTVCLTQQETLTPSVITQDPLDESTDKVRGGTLMNNSKTEWRRPQIQ
jgi:hypothetical protein